MSLREKIARLFGRAKKRNKDIVDAFIEACAVVGIKPSEALERLMWSWLQENDLEAIYLMRLPPRFQPMEFTISLMREGAQAIKQMRDAVANIAGDLVEEQRSKRSFIGEVIKNLDKIATIADKLGITNLVAQAPDKKKLQVVEEVDEPLTIEDIEGE